MAADPNVVVSTRPDYWAWVAPDWSDYAEGDTAPAGKSGWTKVKVRETLYNDGRIVRNVLDANGAPVSAAGMPATASDAARALDATPQYNKGQQERFKDAQTTAAAAGRNVKSKYQGVFPAGHPRAGMPATITEYESGEPDYVEIVTPAASQDEWHTEGTPLPDGTTDNARPIMARTVNGVKQTRQPTAKELEDWHLAGQMTRNPGGKTDAEIAAEAEKNKPQVIPSTVNTTSPNMGTQMPDGSIRWEPNKNYQNPNPQPINIPGNPRTIYWDDGPGKPVRTEKNAAYVKPSKIMPHPSDPTKMVNVTEDDNGNPVILPVDDKTTIKPADLPVLQSKYGEIAQGLGALAQELNSRYARGEITEKQRQDAFTAAHQQAATQVAEINSILENSRAIWTGQVNQRGQTLGETQSRRAYASDIFGRAAQTGMGIAESAGPGHGAAIAGGVGALMNIGQRYAEGMGGFRESPEVPLPAALQQAQGIGLPGYPMPGAPGAAPAAGASIGAPNQAAAATGEAQRQQQAAGLPPPIFRPPPPVAGSVAPGMSGSPQPPGINPPAGEPGNDPTQPVGMGAAQNPGLAAMSQYLQSGSGFSGSPVAAGGLGVYDPTQDAQRMLHSASLGTSGTDPDWAQAVQQAAAGINQPGYAWQRFGQPASRFG